MALEGVESFFGFFSESDSIGVQLKRDIDSLKKSHPEGWQEMAMKLIQKARIDEPNQEIHRLRSAEVITPEIESKMDQAVERFDNRTGLKAMLGRVLEIQKLYGDSHHVFVHAQATKWLVYPDLVKEMMKLNHPEKDLHHFKFLRIPSAEERNIEEYSKNPLAYDSSRKGREDLLSVDGYFYNNDDFESALDFLSENGNIMDGESVIGEVAAKALQSFYPSMSGADAEEYGEKISQMGERGSLGNLFIFCLEKGRSAQVQYRAHAYGRPCRCHPGEDDKAILDLLQRGDLNQKSECAYKNPQYRLFTPALKKEENGVKSFLIPPERILRKKVKREIQKLVLEIHQKYSKTSSPCLNPSRFAAIAA